MNTLYTIYSDFIHQIESIPLSLFIIQTFLLLCTLLPHSSFTLNSKMADLPISPRVCLSSSVI